MKTAAVYRTKNVAPAYPNAADRRYFIDRFVEGALTAATITGFLTAVLFFILL